MEEKAENTAAVAKEHLCASIEELAAAVRCLSILLRCRRTAVSYLLYRVEIIITEKARYSNKRTWSTCSLHMTTSP